MLRSLLLSASLLAGCKAAPAPSSTPTTSEKDAPVTVARKGTVAEDAERQVAARRTSSYVHDTHVDEASGTFQYDCSGFVNYTLKEVAPAAFAEVAAVRARPNARAYHDFFSTVPPQSLHWRSFERATEIQRGDLIAWLEPTDTDSTNTGHVVIAVAAPVVNAMKREATVDVIDSARSGHGTTDTRPRGEGGVGRGPIVLELDPNGRPRAFRWSPEKNSQPHEVSITMGRIVGGSQ